MKTHQLAIVIPAYKAKYLRDTLESISQQTCKNFTLYIGDDHSPEDIYSIVQQFENKINIIYFILPPNTYIIRVAYLLQVTSTMDIQTLVFQYKSYN